MALARKLRGGVSTVVLHVRVALLLALLPVLLWRRPVQQVIQLLTPRALPAPQTWDDVLRVHQAVQHLYYRRGLNAYGPCLRRSLTLYYFLTRLGYPVQVAMGATTRRGQLSAHAWLTLDGTPVLERDSVSPYKVMAVWGGMTTARDRHQGAAV